MENSEQGSGGGGPQSIGTQTDQPVDAIDSGQQPGGQDVNEGGVGKGPARRPAAAKRGDAGQPSGALGDDQRVDDAVDADVKKGP